MTCFIDAKNVSLEFPIIEPDSYSLRKSIVNLFRAKKKKSPGTFCALRNISLHLEPGTKLGIIGRNGSGKSTLLRVLAGIYTPTSGNLIARGNISPIFTTALGSIEDLSGYKNIILQAKILGFSLKKEDIKNIIDFSELGDFIHYPYRTYSEGMKVRIGFSVTTYMVSEILLMDEMIGAGDAAFIKKAAKRRNELVKKAKILVLASHSRNILREFCKEGIVMKAGEIVFYGKIEDALEYYSEAYD